MTAYYFGVRHGTYAAAAAAVAFVAAMLVPGAKWPIYGGVAVFVLAISLLGPRFGRPVAKATLLVQVRRSATWAMRRLGRR